MDNFVGEIKIFGGNYAPEGWAFCQGQKYQITQYQALWSLLGTTYGGDGRNTFAVPNLQGQIPVGVGTGPGLAPCILAKTFGAEIANISYSNMPSHTHSVNAVTAPGTVTSPTGNLFASRGKGDFDFTTALPNVEMNSQLVGIAGVASTTPISTVQPYLALNYIIALEGIYPQKP